MLDISGPFNGKPAARHAEPAAHLRVPAGRAQAAHRAQTRRLRAERRFCARRWRAARYAGAGDRRGHRAAARHLQRRAASDRDFDTGIERALEALLSSPKFLIRDRARARRRRSRARIPAHRPRAGLAPVVLPLEEHPGRRAARHRRARPAEGSGGARAAGAAHARRSARDALHERLRRASGCEVRNIHAQDPDRSAVPDFDDTLRDAMATETELFFESQVREDRPIQELLRANYTFLNERLARHYGIADVYGSHFRRVTLDRRDALRPARPGERADGHLVRATARRSCCAASGSSRTCSARRRRRRRRTCRRSRKTTGGEADVAARAHGAAPQQPGLRDLPLAHGSAGLRARELRRDRQVARQRRRRRDQLDDRAVRRGRSRVRRRSARRC